MAHGAADWGAMAPKNTVLGLQDMGELAVRLGSINTFDRKGDVIWMDDFEDNKYKWVAYFYGAGAAFDLSTDTARNGGKCMKLTGGNTLTRKLLMVRTLPFPALSALGLEVSFLPKSDVESVDFVISLQDGVTAYYMGFRIVIATMELQIKTGLNSWAAIDTLSSFYTATGAFATIKFTGDFVTGKYVRLLIQDKKLDLSAHTIWSQPDAVTPRMGARITAVSNVGTNCIVYIDDVIVTQNEP